MVLAVIFAAFIPLFLNSNNSALAQTDSSAALAAPELNATPSGTNAVELSWTQVSGAARYELWAWYDDATGWQRLDDGTLTETSYTHGELPPGRTYHYAVGAVDANGTLGEWSEYATATVAGTQTPPSAPALTAEAGNGQVTLTWEEVADAVGYELWAWWHSAIGWQPVDDGKLTGTAYIHIGLAAGKTYHYTIRALDDNGDTSEWSEHAIATVLETHTPSPTLTLEVGAGQITLTWEPVASAVRYELWAWRDKDTGWQRLDDGGLTGTSYTHGGLRAGTSYYFVIRAMGAHGSSSEWSEYASASVLESLAIPEAPGERAALEALYLATDGANWSKRDNWMTGEPISTWQGVTTDDSGHVTGLTLILNRLSGQLPDLSALTRLTFLFLGGNQLTGPVPDLDGLTNLAFLYLGENRLTGPVPELSPVSKLTLLDLGNNQLTGPIPDLSSLNELSYLDLSANMLTGQIPDLGALTKLTQLDLSANMLTGPAPEVSALTNLTRLSLSSNELAGPIPDLSGLLNLRGLYLDNNQLTGSIPDLRSLPSLIVLDFTGNQLCSPDGSGLTGLMAPVEAHLVSLNLPTCAG